MTYYPKARLVPVLAACLAVAAIALAHNPRGKAEATFNGKEVTVEYGRPSLNGRDMLAQATPGMVWRLGSENATTITTEGDLMIGPNMAAAGAYSLFAKKTDDGWDLLVNSETGQPGLAHDPEKDLFSAPLKVETTDDSAEMFTISLMADGMNGTLKMQWGNTALVTDLMIH